MGRFEEMKCMQVGGDTPTLESFSVPAWSDWGSRTDPAALPYPSSVVYICAPYGDKDPAVVQQNIERAEKMARYAVYMGYSPVVVHSYIDRVFGDDNDPELRKRGLGCVVSIAWAVAMAGGKLWLMQKPNGSITSGCAKEVNIFRSATRSGDNICFGTWDNWSRSMAMHHFVEDNDG